MARLAFGTMLVTADQWVFRLNQNDLTPTGKAPALVVLDAEEVKAVFKEAERLKIEDMDAYFTKYFNIPSSLYLNPKKLHCSKFKIFSMD